MTAAAVVGYAAHQPKKRGRPRESDRRTRARAKPSKKRKRVRHRLDGGAPGPTESWFARAKLRDVVELGFTVRRALALMAPRRAPLKTSKAGSWRQ